MLVKYDGSNMEYYEFEGTPEEIGRAHAEKLGAYIKGNLDVLIYKKEIAEALDKNEWYQRWLENNIRFNEKEFPELIREIESISKYSQIPPGRLFDLAFCGWGYANYKGTEKTSCCCSAMAITLKDGSVACCSTLDDSAEIWPCPVKYKPAKGYSFITTVWPGTSWAGRGMNSEGLCLNTAALGVGFVDRGRYDRELFFNLGFLFRTILQTCSTVGDVRYFCREYAFGCNLVCVDRNGGIFGVHQTLDGPYEITGDGCASAANTVTDDRIIYKLGLKGFTHYEHPTSRLRHGNIADFISRMNRKCTLEEVAEFYGTRDDSNPGTIHNKGTAFITLAVPQKFNNAYWLKRPSNPTNSQDFIEFKI